MTQNILLHYGEIAIKGRNRPRFINRLIDNIKKALRDQNLGQVQQPIGAACTRRRVRASPFDPVALKRLGQVFGLTSYAPAVRCNLDIRIPWPHVAWEMIKDRSYENFRVTSRRAFKDVPFPSVEVNMAVGGKLLEKRHASR